jgi:predicted nucleic acid-binding protein
LRFWDASALVPLLISESATTTLQERYAEDPAVAAWWGADLECVSALARREREGALPDVAMAAAIARLDELRSRWFEVRATEELRRTARRLLRTHDLRAADSMQLAAALIAAEGRPDTLEFVTLDERLSSAARREGFAVLTG